MSGNRHTLMRLMILVISQIMEPDLIIMILAWMACFLMLRRGGHILQRRERRWWVRPLNQNRALQGDYYNLFHELKFDETILFRYIRMDLQTFHELLIMVYLRLLKRSPRALPPEHRLLLALRNPD